ncbi:hypothetical protein ABPG77_000231 [Micractinium sp. CCAP 211/92]
MGNPCFGKEVKLRDIKQPGATILLVALTPGASAGLACVRWTNPAGGGAALPPLPSLELLDVQAARHLLHSLLAAAPAGTRAYIYSFEGSAGGPAGAVNPFGAALLGRNAAELQAVVANPPGVVAHTGRVTSNALAATLRLKGPQKRQAAALKTAVAAFPQAAPRLRSLKEDGALVLPLLVLAHVLGAKAQLPAQQAQQQTQQAQQVQPQQVQQRAQQAQQVQQVQQQAPQAQQVQIQQVQQLQEMQQGQAQEMQQAHQVQAEQAQQPPGQGQQQAVGPAVGATDGITDAAALTAALTPQRAAAAAAAARHAPQSAASGSAAAAAAEPWLPTPGPLRRVRRRLGSPEGAPQLGGRRQAGPRSRRAAAADDVIDLTQDD